MGSKTFDGVWFISFADDHEPPHIHGKYSETTVILDLVEGGKVQVSSRKGAIKPLNRKQSDVRKIIKTAVDHAAALHELWEVMHG